ncbi:MAG: hypothetical protein ACI8X5_004098, partial [Planctomycetota bacterium]
ASGFAELHLPAIPSTDDLLVEMHPAGSLRVQVSGPLPSESFGGEAFLWRLGGDQKTGEELASTNIDEQGFLRFADLAAGEYSICLRVDGWGMGVYHAATVRLGEATELEINLERGARVYGQVLLKDSSETVSGVLVTATPRFQGVSADLEEKGEHQVLTDADGRYAFEGLSSGTLRIEVEAPWGSISRANLEVFESGDEVEKDFEVGEPGSFSGGVVNSSKQGVGFATVVCTWNDEVISSDLALSASVSSGSIKVESDINGRFHIEGIPSQVFFLVLAYRGEENGSAYLDALMRNKPAQKRLKSGEERENQTITLQDVQTIQGAVRDDQGAGVEDIHLHLALVDNRSKSKKSMDLMEVITSADGEFELPNLNPGRYSLECEAEDYLRASLSFSISPKGLKRQDLELELRAAESITGWCVDEFGESVPFARVSAKPVKLNNLSGKKMRTKSTRADEYGRYDFESVQPGTYWVSAKAAGYEGTLTPVTVYTASGQSIELKLRRKTDTARTIVFGTLATSDRQIPRGLRVKDARGGAFSVGGDSFQITGVRPGEARFTFTAPGYASFKTAPVVLPEGGQISLGLIELKAAGDLTVFVRNHKGKPCTTFTARLEAIKGTKAAKKASALRLGLSSMKHKYKGIKKAVKGRAARSTAVPLRSWRLIIEAPGHKPDRRTLRFTDSLRAINIEIQLSKG